MTDSDLAYLTPEARARMEIDRMLREAGWAVQNYSQANLSASRGVAIREFVLTPPHGRADYLLFVDGRAVGVIEAKKEGETLTGVAWQTAKYLDGLPDHVTPALEGALPFAYQSTGIETRFTNVLEPEAKSREVFWFHRPETFAGWVDLRESPRAPTLRGRLRLGEVARVLNGFAFKSDQFSKTDGVPLLRIRDVGKEAADVRFDGAFDPAYLIRAGDQVVGMDGEFRTARWTGADALLNQRVCKVEVRDPSVYEGDFLLYALPGYLSAINQRTSAITVKHLSSRTVAEIPLPLPPLPEQRRIVAAIEEQFSHLDAADASLAAAGRRVEVFQRRAFDMALSGDWSWTTLGEIAEIAGGVTKDSKRQGDPALVEVPYLRVANVQRGFLDLTSVTTIRVTPEKALALALRTGDVLFNEGGDRDKLGRGWVWNGEIEPCIHQNHVFRARLTEGFEPKFVSWHGNTFGREWFETNGRQTTNLASINLSTLRRFPVPAPPLDEQRQIVSEMEERLSVIEAMRIGIATAQRRSAALRRSILECAFLGELVHQDPSDEPASVLLERIRSERAAQPKPRRGRRAGTAQAS